MIEFCHNLQPTKENFHDSLGLISPISLPIKFILQKLFELKINWDNRIDVETNNFGKNILTPKF